MNRRGKYNLPPSIWEDEFARWWAAIVVGFVLLAIFLVAFPDFWLEAGP